MRHASSPGTISQLMCCECLLPCRASREIRDLAKLLDGADDDPDSVTKAINVLSSIVCSAEGSAGSNEHAAALRGALKPFQEAVAVNASLVGAGWMSSSSDESDGESDGGPGMQPPCPLRMAGNLTQAAALPPAAAGAARAGGPAFCAFW